MGRHSVSHACVTRARRRRLWRAPVSSCFLSSHHIPPPRIAPSHHSVSDITHSHDALFRKRPPDCLLQLLGCLPPPPPPKGLIQLVGSLVILLSPLECMILTLTPTRCLPTLSFSLTYFDTLSGAEWSDPHSPARGRGMSECGGVP